MMRVNLYWPVHVKTLTSQKHRALLTARKLLQEKAIAIEYDIRGLLRNFGLKVGLVGKVKFEEGELTCCCLISNQSDESARGDKKIPPPVERCPPQYDGWGKLAWLSVIFAHRDQVADWIVPPHSSGRIMGGPHRPSPERSAILRRHQSPEVRVVRRCLTSPRRIENPKWCFRMLTCVSTPNTRSCASLIPTCPS